MIDCTDAFWVLVDEHGRLVNGGLYGQRRVTIYPTEASAKRGLWWVHNDHATNKVSVRKAYLALAVEGE